MPKQTPSRLSKLDRGNVGQEKEGERMGRYLFLWEIDKDKIPMDPKQRADGWLILMGLIRQDFEKGILKDWGAFVSEINGYAVVEGSEVEVELMTNQYIPLVFFEIHPIATADQIEEYLKIMSSQ
jgi:hypothetical protein